MEEFETAIRLVTQYTTFDTDVVVSVFETNIRMLGWVTIAVIVSYNFVFPRRTSCQLSRRKWPTESFWLGVSWGESSGNFLLTPLKKVTIWAGEVIRKTKLWSKRGIKPETSEPRLVRYPLSYSYCVTIRAEASTLSTKLFLLCHNTQLSHVCQLIAMQKLIIVAYETLTWLFIGSNVCPFELEKLGQVTYVAHVYG